MAVRKPDKRSVRLALLQSERMLNWWGDSIIDRAPQVQMRPPAALPSPAPKPRPPPARVLVPRSKPTVDGKGATDASPPPANAPAAGPSSSAAAALAGGRPVRMPRPSPRQRFSQQEVFSMMGDSAASEQAVAARKAAAARVAERQAAAQRAAKAHAEAERAAEAEAYAAECQRMRSVFGIEPAADEPPAAGARARSQQRRAESAGRQP